MSDFGARWSANDPVDAVVVKPDRDTAWGEKDGDAVADDQGSGEIDLEAAAAVQFDREHLKRRALAQRLKDAVKVVSRHALLPPSGEVRSAAYSRQARMSSAVKSGKSARISSGDMPPARYSRTSCTVMRSPRMHGCPLRLSGSMVMRCL